MLLHSTNGMFGGAPSGALSGKIDSSSSKAAFSPSGTKTGGSQSEVSLSLSNCSIKFGSESEGSSGVLSIHLTLL